MCGIAGMIGRFSGDPHALVRSMARALAHRGPDDEGVWAENEVALGHRRLSILDLSAAGHQPMLSEDERYALVYNGEIYNHLDLRIELEAAGAAPTWRGHSDTETLLAGVARWGLEQTLRRAVGMFALALWDRKARRLHLARDRFGEKPLYWAKVPEGLLFASEIKALERVPGFRPSVDPEMLRFFLGRGHLPADRTLFRDGGQVPPGTIVCHDGEGRRVGQTRFYDYAKVAEREAHAPFASMEETLDALRNVLSAAVSRQLIADVELGVLLSGGIDSSLVAGMAARAVGPGLKTFSIGFHQAGYDEAPYARAVANALGTDHHELYVEPADALALVEKLPVVWDEPFGDSSQLPTLIVSRFARQHVTVALTGDGGDEMFGGYNRHAAVPRLSRLVGRVPPFLSAPFLRAVEAVPPSAWTAAGSLRGAKRPDFLGHKIRRIARIARNSRGLPDIYNRLLDQWDGLGHPVAGIGAVATSVVPEPDALDPTGRIMLADALSYLPGDILTKVDRAGMAVSLEARMPFLDPNVAEAAARVPPSHRFSAGRGKGPLRRLLSELVPSELIDRPKAGFSVPIGGWLRGPLRDWAEAHLSPDALKASPILNGDAITPLWRAHLANQANHGDLLWNVLMFQAWNARQAS
jgi:asparagine synthase (glutamine-hydrolysing)